MVADATSARPARISRAPWMRPGRWFIWMLLVTLGLLWLVPFWSLIITPMKTTGEYFRVSVWALPQNPGTIVLNIEREPIGLRSSQRDADCRTRRVLGAVLERLQAAEVHGRFHLRREALVRCQSIDLEARRGKRAAKMSLQCGDHASIRQGGWEDPTRQVPQRMQGRGRLGADVGKQVLGLCRVTPDKLSRQPGVDAKCHQVLLRPIV